MSNQQVKRLNYTSVSISNDELNTSNRRLNAKTTIGRHNLIKPKFNSENKHQKLMYEKSSNKGSNTNLSRIIKNKNLYNQSNSSLNKTLKADANVTVSQDNLIDLKNNRAILSTITNKNLSKFDRKSSASNQIISKSQSTSLSNPTLFRSKSTPNLNQKKISSNLSINEIIKLNKNDLKSSQSIATKNLIPKNQYESIENLEKTTKKSKKGQIFKYNNVSSFSTIWNNQKFLYYNIQEIMFSLNVLSTLALFGLSIWINADERFIILASLSNALIYSSFNRLIGILPFICISICIFGLCVDFSNIVLHIFVKRFLDNHDDQIIKKIINNQKTLAEIAERNVPNKLKSLKLRGKIIYTMKSTLRNIRIITLLNSFAYVFVFISVLFFIGIYLHFLSHKIINYQLSQSLIKLIREYEKQQIIIINQMDEIQKTIKNVATNTIEEVLINKLNTKFECCHYQNPFQFGELAPISCNFKSGCLRPLQEFVWEYLYFTVIIFLTIASLKTCIIFVLLLNFRVILTNRLFKKLYEIDIRKYRLKFQELNPEENKDAGDNEDEDEMKQKFAKLQEIRNKKFEQLQREEEEEFLRKEKEEIELNLFLENEKRQEAYEILLLKQKRFDEYHYQQLQRKIQLQHFLDRREANFED
jgi:hypothetical protein